MSVVINVNGTNSGGGSQQTPPPNPTPPSSPTPSYGYTRPDPLQYAPTSGATNTPLPTSDAMVQDIRREMVNRGVVLVPGTSNFSTMMNTLRDQQRRSAMNDVDRQFNRSTTQIDAARDSYLNEVYSRLETAREEELKNAPFHMRKTVNARYDRMFADEEKEADKFFAPFYDKAKSERDSQRNDVEQRLTDAIKRLTDELSHGGPSSYLGRLRQQHKEALYRRDTAQTEEEAREASREAAKIRERIARAQGSSNSSYMGLLRGAGAVIPILAQTWFQYDKLQDQREWGLGIEQAGSILSGNAAAAIRQRNAYASQQASTLWSGGSSAAGALIGALLGSFFPGAGTIVGSIIGGLVGNLGGQAGAWYLGGNRARAEEDAKTKAIDLWKQEEARFMQYNELAMLTRGDNSNIKDLRNWWIGWSEKYDPNSGVNKLSMQASLLGGQPGVRLNTRAFVPDEKDEYLDLYDLGYTAPEFARAIVPRMKQRGFIREDSIQNALYADALERIFSMNSGALSSLSAYDRFGRNNAVQDFSNLVVGLSRLGTTGMQSGAYARSDEFAGYMSQLQGSQRSTFLTVDNARAARQVLTGQAIFGDEFGNEALQGIQAVNNQVQNPGQGFGRTLLYDVIQELYPDARGNIAKINEYMYSKKPNIQNEIQKAFAKRVATVYGGADTPGGFLAFRELYGIKNPNVLNPLIKQMTEGGGLEANGLPTADTESLVTPLTKGGYTPTLKKQEAQMADSMLSTIATKMNDFISISDKLLKTLTQETNKTLQEAVEVLKR